MKIKFDLDDDLPLNKLLKLHNMTIVVRPAFQKQQILSTSFFR